MIETNEKERELERLAKLDEQKLDVLKHQYLLSRAKQEADSEDEPKPKTNKQLMDEVYAELDQRNLLALEDRIIASHQPKVSGATDSRLDLYSQRMKRFASTPTPEPIHDGSSGVIPK